MGDCGRGRRLSPRFNLQAPAEFECAGVRGSGVTAAFSFSGVRIDTATAPVKPGDLLELRFSLFVDSFSTVFNGEVVRETQDGFAVRFLDLEAPHLEILKRAFVPCPGRS